MRALLIATSLIAAPMVEWLLESLFVLSGASFPITVGVLFFWLWEIPIVPRIISGIVAGIIMDSISMFPFGTHMLTFVMIVLIIEFLRLFFSNIESLLTRAIGLGFSLITHFVILIFMAGILESIMNVTSIWSYTLLWHTLYASLMWSVLFPIIIFGAIHFLWRSE